MRLSKRPICWFGMQRPWRRLSRSSQNPTLPGDDPDWNDERQNQAERRFPVWSDLRDRGRECARALGTDSGPAQAIELSDQFGIGWCSARNITHASRIFHRSCGAAGHIGIVMTASKPLMSYFGARVEGVSTNPIAIAAPNPSGGKTDHPRYVDLCGLPGKDHGGKRRRTLYPHWVGGRCKWRRCDRSESRSNFCSLWQVPRDPGCRS